MLKKRRLNFESLEGRRLLAGNVTARVSNGELIVTGDNAANSIQIVGLPGADGSGRTYRVIGRPFDGAFSSAGNPVNTGATTTVNLKSQPVEFFASAAKVTINTRGGNDAVILAGTTSRFKTNGLNIDTGLGRDYVRVATGDDSSLNPVIIRTANAIPDLADRELDNETVIISDFTARRSMQMSTGGGDDRVTISDYSVVNGTTLINTGVGRDIVRVTRSDFDRFSLQTGASTTAQSNANDERDQIFLTNVRADSANLVLGGGNDLLVLAGGIQVAGVVTVNGGVGTDEIRGTANVVFVGSFVQVGIELTS